MPLNSREPLAGAVSRVQAEYGEKLQCPPKPLSVALGRSAGTPAREPWTLPVWAGVRRAQAPASSTLFGGSGTLPGLPFTRHSLSLLSTAGVFTGGIRRSSHGGPASPGLGALCPALSALPGHARTHTQTRGAQGVTVQELALLCSVSQCAAPPGCLKRLIQPVCLGAILFIILRVTSKSSVFLAHCVRVVECLGFGCSRFTFPNVWVQVCADEFVPSSGRFPASPPARFQRGRGRGSRFRRGWERAPPPSD